MRDCWPAPRPMTEGLVRGWLVRGRRVEESGGKGKVGDTLAVQGIADGVGLCVFESDCCDCEVSESGVGKGRRVFWYNY